MTESHWEMLLEIFSTSFSILGGVIQGCVQCPSSS